MAAPAAAQTRPTGGAFVAGAGSIAAAGAATTITQSSARGIVTWQGFSIGSGASVQVNNGAGATLNRVTGTAASQIDGSLHATGSVYLINPNGVVVGPDGKVVTGGSFVASTRDMPDAQFMAGGAATLSGSSAAGVTNAGRIVSQTGDVVLVGATAANTGTIKAPNGTAALAAGNQVVLSSTSGPAHFYVAPDGTATGDASNSGRIKAAAVALASAGGNVYALAGNRTGLIQATGSKTINGQVWLTAPEGTVSMTGRVGAVNADGSGGRVVANGRTVAIGSTAVISASGTRGGTVLIGTAARGGKHLAKSTTIAAGAQILATGSTGAGSGGHIETSGRSLSVGAATVNAGQGGTWLLDPTQNLTIDAAAASTIDASLAGDTSVTVQTTASGTSGPGTPGAGPGDIGVTAPITWSTGAGLTLSAFNGITIGAPITVAAAGTLNLATNNNVGGASSGNGALTFVMGLGSAQFTGSGGALTINSTPYTLVTTMDQLQAVGSTGYYALAGNLNAAATSGFSPIAEGTPFTGTFDGLGNAISNLSINSAATYVGLFGQIGAGGAVANLGLFGGSVVATGTPAYVGALAGGSFGTIANSYATGSVRATADGVQIVAGGLVGFNSGTITGSDATGSVAAGVVADGTQGSAGGLTGQNSGTVTQSFATGSVSAGFAGGLVGYNYYGSTITDSDATGSATGASSAGGLVAYNSAAITGSYASGSVSAGMDAGGLVGLNLTGTITASYATGGVSAGSRGFAGGLVGYNGTNSSIATSYATGAVSVGSGGAAGGLVGFNDSSSSVANSYWDETTTGLTNGLGAGSDMTNVANLTGLAAGTATSAASYANFGTVALVGGSSNSNADAISSGGTVVWYILDGGTRPLLAWEAPSSGSPLPDGTYAVTNGHQLQLMAIDLAASYTLVDNIDLSEITSTVNSASPTTASGVWGSAGFVPIGEPAGFSGTFNGAGHTISNLTIDAPDTDHVGLFGNTAPGAVIENVGLLGGSVTGGFAVGELIGLNDGGAVSATYATGSVNAQQYGGGLVGENEAGVVSDSYATGSVINNSIAGGGLVGGNLAGGLISDSYATGRVVGSGAFGGLVGFNDAASTVSDSYWDEVTTGQSVGIGQNAGTATNLVGLTAGTAYSAASYANFGTAALVGGASDSNAYAISNNGTVVWYILDGGTRPLLAWEAPSNGAPLGDGSYAVTNGHQLQLMAIDLTASYTLANAIDLSEITSTASSASPTTPSGVWSTGGFVPVGDSTTAYAGTFNGAGHTINGLTIDSADEPTGFVPGDVGLFGQIAADGAVENVGLVGGSVVGGTLADVGALAGQNSGTVANSYATVSVGTGMFGSAGGLVGVDAGSIADSHATGGVGGGGDTGGLAGSDTGSIADSYATGAVTNAVIAGGLVGYEEGSVTNSHATGQVSASGVDGTVAGGLIGFLDDTQGGPGTVAGSYATGTVSGGAFADGGLVGRSEAGTIATSYATGIVQGGSGSSAGGLVGLNGGGASITEAYAAGSVGGGASGSVGGLVGANNQSSIATSYATGSVSGGSTAGGLVGINLSDGSVTTSYASGAVAGGTTEGGLIGSNDSTSTVANSYWDAVTTGQTLAVGSAMGTITNVVGLVAGTATSAASYANFGTVALVGGASDSNAYAISSGGTAAWYILDGGTRPLLAWEAPSNGQPLSNGSYAVTTGHALQLMAIDLTASYTLANDISLSEIASTNNSASNTVPSGVWGPAGFVPVGDSTTAYTGTFNGAGHVIAGLTIDSAASKVGLFGQIGSGGAVDAVGLIGAAVTGTAGGADVGALAGVNRGAIANSDAAGSVTGGDDAQVGGLVGQNGGTITGSFATAGVTGGFAAHAGGLAGLAGGTITDSYATGSVVTGDDGYAGGLVGLSSGTIAASYASGSASAGNYGYAGGLAGVAGSGTLTTDYATGSATVGLDGSVGGLVGSNYSAISDSYATGNVSGGAGSLEGGLVGLNATGIGSVDFNYWDVTTTGQTMAAGAGGDVSGNVGLAAGTAYSVASYANLGTAVLVGGNSDANVYAIEENGLPVWYILDGNTRPLLAWEAPSNTAPLANGSYAVANGHQLQLIAVNLADSYTLANDIDLSEITSTANSASGTTPSGVWGPAGFAPVGSYVSNTSATAFTGTFDGQGHVISNLTIDSGGVFIGLFGALGTGGAIENVGLSSAAITATGADEGAFAGGALAGANFGTIIDSYATGSLTGGPASIAYVGGLVGANIGVLSQSYANVTVTMAAGSEAAVGGLVGLALGGSIADSYALGSVTTGGDGLLGGLAGGNEGATITTSYASGAVAGGNGSILGGFVGINTGTIANSYFDVVTTGQSVGAGEDDGTTTNLVGLPAGSAYSASSYANFGTVALVGAASDANAYAITSGGSVVWYILDGGTRPLLAWEAPSNGTPLADGSYAVGNGHQLQLMAVNLAAGYTLANGIDLSEITSTANSASGTTPAGVWGPGGFVPVGDGTTAYTGTFNGAGHAISSLTINDSAQYVGLFGQAGQTAVLENISLTGGTITASGQSVGALAGYSQGRIANAAASVGVDASSEYAGGLAGESSGVITDSSATGAVAGNDDVGGLLGGGSGTVAYSTASGAVSGGPFDGGLVGNFAGTITNSSATGTVSGVNDVGGLLGSGTGLVTVSFATGAITGGPFAGGLVGEYDGTIIKSHATGAVTSNEDVAGGLVGETDGGAITDSYATGGVNGNTYAGGLVGENAAAITGSYATGAVAGGVFAGGLVADNTGTITNSYATGAATGSIFAGGLVAQNNGTITTSYATGGVGSGVYVGGLVGDNAGTITGSFWDTATTGQSLGVGSGTATGATGLATQAWLTQGPIATNIFSTLVWVAGYPYPVLKALPYVLITGTGVQTYGNAALTSASIVSITDQNDADATGLVGNTGGIMWLTGALPTSPVAGSPYVLGGQGATVSAGYQLTYTGAVTLDPRALTITADNQSKTYGQTTNLGSTAFTDSGLVNADTVTGVTLTSPGTPASATVAGSSYAITASGAGGSGVANYAITYDPGALTVLPAAMTITAANQAKTYGQPANLGSTAFTETGLVNSDTVSGVTLTSAGAPAGATVAGSPYAILASDALGSGLANYTIAYLPGLLTVNPLPVPPVPVPLVPPAPVVPIKFMPVPLPSTGAALQFLLLSGGDVLLPLGSGGFGPLPLLIRVRDALGMAVQDDGALAFSTGLPLTVTPEGALLLGGYGVHYTVVPPGGAP